MSIVSKGNGTPLEGIEHGGVTALYCLPELWAGAIKTSTMCHAVDVWSFVAEIFNGKPLMGVGDTNAYILAVVVAWSTAWTRRQPSRQLFLILAHL